MIIVTDIFLNVKKQKILNIKIHTACCKSDFLVIDESADKLFNPITNDYVLKGMVASIRLAEKQYEERLSKSNKV